MLLFTDSKGLASTPIESRPQTESNTVQSTAASTIATKTSVFTSDTVTDSAVTSIPSEAKPIQSATSVDSNSILHLIDDTFQTSATANRGGDNVLDQPYRRNAKCSAPHPPETPCNECAAIENDIELEEEKQHVSSTETIPMENINANNLNDSKPQIASIADKNVWHMPNIPNIGKVDQMYLAPITVCNTQATNNTANETIQSILDNNTAFIVLHDENENATKYPTGNDAFNRPCDDCCFCNPNLSHSKKSAGEEQCSSRKCNFCISSRQQSTQTTPAQYSCCRNQPKLATPSNESNQTDRSTTEHIFERKCRSTHSHIRRQVKDSDTINTICTKKLNRTTRKTTQLINDNATDTNANDTSKANDKTDEMHDLNGNKARAHKKTTLPKLPPTSRECWHSHSNDTQTTSPSSSSNESTSKVQRRRNSKSVPNLPKAERWPNVEAKCEATKAKDRSNSRYQDFYSDTDRTVATNHSTTKTKPAGIIIKVVFATCDFLMFLMMFITLSNGIAILTHLLTPIAPPPLNDSKHRHFFYDFFSLFVSCALCNLFFVRSIPICFIIISNSYKNAKNQLHQMLLCEMNFLLLYEMITVIRVLCRV